MEQDINNIEQFKQCLYDVAAPENNVQAAAEMALKILEFDHPYLYVSYLLDALAFSEELPRVAAGLVLGNSLRMDSISHSLYDKIFEQYLLVSEEPTESSWRFHLRALPYILSSLVHNQLKENVDTLFNKYMTLFDSDTRPGQVTQAIVAAELLFDEGIFQERSKLVKAQLENSSRLQLVFDKLVHLLKMNNLEFSRYLYPALCTALKSAEYLSDESVRSLVLQRALELIDISPSTAYQVLGSCLSQVYEHLEPFMDRLISGISKIDDSYNAIEEKSYENRVETVFNFWSDLCRLEKKIREDNEEFLYLETPPTVPYLELLQRYGDQVLDQLLSVINSMDIPDDDGSWCDQYMQCIVDISRDFNIDISPYLDYVTAGRTKLFLSAGSHWTQIFAMIKDDSLSDGIHPINLRVSPSFLINAVNSQWPNFEDQQLEIKVKGSFVQGAVEYLPMYDRSVQDNCIKVACASIMFTQDKQLGPLADILRLKIANKFHSTSIFRAMLASLNSRDHDALSEAENKFFINLVQFYPLMEATLQRFIYTSLHSIGRKSCKLLYHLIKPLQQAPEESDNIYDEVIEMALFNEDDEYDDALLLLGLLCQKLGAAIPSEMYSEIWKRLPERSRHSYKIFDAVACITPPAGVSYLSHLETIINLFKKQLHVTDDVHVEYAIRGLITLLNAFKNSSNEFLFVGQIKRIIDILQPALENEPSIETMRAYLTFIRSLSTIDQASSALRTESVMSVLKHASEQSDGTTRHLALSVKKALDGK